MQVIRRVVTPRGSVVVYSVPRKPYNRLPKSATAEDRFFARIEQGDHWLWTGYVDKDGYAKFAPHGSKSTCFAHRWSYEHFVRPLEPGEVVDHGCRIRHCVRPDCLEAVTPGENVRRGLRSRGVVADRSMCSHGHELTPENVRVTATGYRACKECQRLAGRRFQERQKESA